MAMADLAKHGASGALPLPAIAERQQISLAYLEQLFLKLRRAGRSPKAIATGSPAGALDEAGAISVADVMAAVEEDTRMTRCGGEAAKPCMPGQRCLTHGLWDALGDQIASFLENVTLQEVLDGIPAEKQAARPSRPLFGLHPIARPSVDASGE